MPSASPHARYFLRGSALLLLLLVLWWFFLLNPLLFVLQGAAEFAGSFVLGRDSREFIVETPSGAWGFRVPIEAVLPQPPPHSGATPIHSVDFDMARSDVVVFTFSLPVFWALMLAAPGLRRNLRPLLTGTLVMASVEVVLLLVFAEISARNVVVQLSQLPGRPSAWSLRFAEYLTVHVLPFVAPFLVAVAMHRELRARILGWATEATPTPAALYGGSHTGRSQEAKPRRSTAGPAR